MNTKQLSPRVKYLSKPVLLPAKRQADWIVFLSTFPPRQCGIATFTTDLTTAIDQMFGPQVESKIIALNINDISHFNYSDQVIAEINQTCQEDYFKVADKLNKIKEIKLISVEHEFGIYGGEYGEYLLPFLEKIKKPVVTTFHTVVPEPNKKMLTIVKTILKHSAGIVVMTNNAKRILESDYRARPEQIQVIPHGIHQASYRTSAHAKALLGFSGQLILSTFGFLSSGKGIEYIIEALPQVVEKFPNVRFLVAGVTHPTVLEKEGEQYRNFLIKKVYELGLAKYVLFYNTYFDIHKLLKFLSATDIYLSPSLNPNQTVSGTLSYALGSGLPTISTAFSQAKEDITEEIGLLVGFKNSQAFAEAIIKLLSNDQLRLQMGKNAYFRTRCMTWQNVSLTYLNFFSQLVPEISLGQKKFPPIKLTHLVNLTDDFGIIQFAKLTEPDVSSGYTIDDNARALIVATLHYKKFATTFSLRLVSTYLNFICLAVRSDGYFNNYINTNQTINKPRNIEEYSEDPSARTLYALARVATTKEIPRHLRKKAHTLLEQSLQKGIVFSSPRAMGFFIKALCCLLSKWKDPKTLAHLKYYCEQLMTLYEKSCSSDWEWFEHYLTYSNAILPEALIWGYKITNEKKYLTVAEKTFDFLIGHTFPSEPRRGGGVGGDKNKIYIPIGQSGWFVKGGTRQYFDQQPEDVTATVEALNTMFQITHKKNYKELAHQAFNWFLGDNILGQVVYDRTTGGCYDGIGEKFINLNQGAESTISYLLARFSFEE